MIFGQDRDELRNMYRDAWAKFCKSRPLTPLESQIAAVIEWHPEYHDEIANEALDFDYTPEIGRSNPYLHMGRASRNRSSGRHPKHLQRFAGPDRRSALRRAPHD